MVTRDTSSDGVNNKPHSAEQTAQPESPQNTQIAQAVGIDSPAASAGNETPQPPSPTIDLSPVVAKQNAAGEAVVVIRHGNTSLDLPEVDGVDVQSDPGEGQTILKGSLASLKLALEQVDVSALGRTGSQAVKFEVSVEGDGIVSTNQKVHVLFDTDSGHFVPRFKLSNDSPFQEFDIADNDPTTEQVATFMRSPIAQQAAAFNQQFFETSSESSLLARITDQDERNQTLLDPDAETSLSDFFTNITETVESIIEEVTPEPVVEEVVEEVPRSLPPQNFAPVALGMDESAANVGVAFNYDISPFFTDPESVPMSFSAEISGGGALPAWLSIDSSTGILSGTPAGGDVGELVLTIYASDGENPTGSDVTIHVQSFDTLYTDVADNVTATAAAEILYFNGGDDTVDGDDGNDTLYGGAGADFVEGKDGDDVVYGGEGDDSVFGGYGADSVYGGDGDDVITGGILNQSFVFGVVAQEADSDSLYGGEGADTFVLLYGLDQSDYIMDFEQGVDKIRIAHSLSGISTFGDDGNNAIHTEYNGGMDITLIQDYVGNVLAALPGNVNLTEDDFEYTWQNEGGTGNDTYNGDGSSQSYYGDDGNDTIDGGGGIDTIVGGNGDDVLSNTGGVIALLNGGGGNDLITADINAGFAVLIGGSGDDTIHGTNGVDNVIQPGSGNNIVYAYDGNDSFSLGEGNDTVYAGDGDDSFSVWNQNGSKFFDGGNGNDSLTGGNGYDTIIGGNGVDDLESGAGGASITGGAGNDEITFWSQNGVDPTLNGAGYYSGGDDDDDLQGSVIGGTTVDGGNGNDTILGSSSGDTVDEIDYLIGGAGDDSITSNGWAVFHLEGGTGADTIAANGREIGINYYNAGETSAATTDSISTGNIWGITFRIAGYTDIQAGAAVGSVLGYTNDGTDTTVTSADTSFQFVIESYTGSLHDFNETTFLFITHMGTSGDDNTTGTAGVDGFAGLEGDDQFDGLADDDTIWGDGGDDTLSGGAGDDIVAGGTGNDSLNGGADDDLLLGGHGSDTMEGGTGSDTFRYRGEKDSLFATSDLIENWEDGVDTIQFMDHWFANFADLTDFEVFSYDAGDDETLLRDTDQDFALRFSGDVTGLLDNSDFSF